MEYFEKIEKNPYEDMYWNLPEQKQGTVNIIGGNAQNFRTEVKTAEYLANNYPVEMVRVVLPEVLKPKLPPMPNFVFLPATTAGSFAEQAGIADAINTADYSLITGELSKNTITGKAVASACESSAKPLLITRDTVDVAAENSPEKLLANENIAIMGSLAQLQKLLRAVYYPKMLLLSQSLVQVVEVLHKFTLSYAVGLVTLHNGQILVARNGVVKAVSLGESGYSPMLMWSGELATKIMAMNMYNPGKFVDATVAAIYHKV